MNQESFLSQFFFIIAVVLANAYSDGMQARRMLEIMRDVNKELARCKSDAYYQPLIWIPDWSKNQWLWHVLKWFYFNLVLLYIVLYCWHWSFLQIGAVAVTSLVFWSIVYRWDALYKKPLDDL